MTPISRRSLLIATAGAGVGDPADSPALFDRLMGLALRLAAKNVLADMQRTVDLVRASDLDWTVVRLPMLTDAPGSGALRVGYVGKDIGSRVARADIADFILERLTDTRYVRASPAISN